MVQERSDAKTLLEVTTPKAQEVIPDTYQEAEQQEHQKVGLQHEDELLQKLFFEVLEKLSAVEERPRIRETCFPELAKDRANRILVVYLRGTNSFVKRTNAVYAMACATKKSM